MSRKVPATRLGERSERTPKGKGRTIKVWVYPDTRDEMRRYGNIIGYSTQGDIRRVRATLTLDPPPPKRKEAK